MFDSKASPEGGEEAPSPVLDVSTRLAMGNAAVAAAAAVDYSGAGKSILLGSMVHSTFLR